TPLGRGDGTSGSFRSLYVFVACRLSSDRALNPIPRAPGPEIAALFAQKARQHHVVHFGGAVDQAGGAGGAVDPFQDGVLGIAARAVELDRGVGGVVQRIRDMHLGHGDFLARAVAAVELPRGVHGEEPPDLNLLRHLAELDLHAFAVGELDAETFAVVDVGLRDVEAALRQAEPAHAVRQPRRAEPDLRHLQAVADAEQHVVVVDFEAVELQLAMPAVLFGAHDGDAAHHARARLVAVIKKRGEAAPPVVGGAGDDDEVRGFAGTGDEPLAAADQPFAAGPLGEGADHARIGAAARRRLGHGEGRFDLAVD